MGSFILSQLGKIVHDLSLYQKVPHFLSNLQWTIENIMDIRLRQQSLIHSETLVNKRPPRRYITLRNTKKMKEIFQTSRVIFLYCSQSKQDQSHICSFVCLDVCLIREANAEAYSLSMWFFDIEHSIVHIHYHDLATNTISFYCFSY